MGWLHLPGQEHLGKQEAAARGARQGKPMITLLNKYLFIKFYHAIITCKSSSDVQRPNGKEDGTLYNYFSEVSSLNWNSGGK